MYISCHMISLQLTVQCYEKKVAPSRMSRGSATADDQFAYFTPGDSNSVYRYKWSTEKWDRLPSSPYGHSGLVIIDNELTAVGGYHLAYHYTNKLFTLRHGQWVKHYPPMNTLRSSPAVVSTSDGNYILVIGGIVDVEVVINWTATVELFHLRSKRWYKLTNLPQAIPFPSATICGNQLHIIGQYGDGYSCSLQTQLSSVQPISILNIFTCIPLPQQPVEWSTAATLCGQLVLVGGKRDRSRVNSIYQLIDGHWMEIGSMSSGRWLCLVVSPSPDKMMIVGGEGGYTTLDSVEECVVV